MVEAEAEILTFPQTAHRRAKFSRRLASRMLTSLADGIGLRRSGVASRPDPVKNGGIQIHDIQNRVEGGL
ncbi:hypothetical protein [Candidatus Rhodoblastus alkanivorans]|uniref:hypothetical protein n=1 Tax=Candidatus Rhodoblastus alkanivorans TaxID=2954117 RepID=UPI0031451150